MMTSGAHAAIEIVQVACRKSSTIERHQRPKVRRNHRHDLEHHIFGLVHFRLVERVENLQAFGDLLSLGLAGRLSHFLTQTRALPRNIEFLKKLADGFGTDSDSERIAPVLFFEFDQALISDKFALLELGVLGVENDMCLEVQDLFEIAQRDL